MDAALKLGAAAAVAAVMTLGSVPASAADADVYGYVGASYGNAKVKASDERFSEWDSAFKVFGGYMFNENIGFEAAYSDLGSPDDAGMSVEELTATSAEVIGVLPLGQFDLFAKIGYAYYDAEFEIAGAGTPTRTGIELASGFGARYNFGNFAVRAEAEAIDVEFADVYNLSMGVQYRF